MVESLVACSHCGSEYADGSRKASGCLTSGLRLGVCSPCLTRVTDRAKFQGPIEGVLLVLLVLLVLIVLLVLFFVGPLKKCY